MKNKTIFAVLSVFLMLFSSACVTTKGQTGAVGGAAGGALIGQAIGRSTEATLIGASVGAMLGYIVGNEMDKQDRARLNQVYETSPSNRTTAWVNPDTGNEYKVTPRPAYRDSQTQRQCREAEILTTIDGKAEKMVTTACREDGRWVMQ